MFRIVSSKRLKRLEKSEDKFGDLLVRINKAKRVLAEQHYILAPLWQYLQKQTNAGQLRNKIRRAINSIKYTNAQDKK